jgi:hypothetical protein
MIAVLSCMPLALIAVIVEFYRRYRLRIKRFNRNLEAPTREDSLECRPCARVLVLPNITELASDSNGPSNTFRSSTVSSNKTKDNAFTRGAKTSMSLVVNLNSSTGRGVSSVDDIMTIPAATVVITNLSDHEGYEIEWDAADSCGPESANNIRVRTCLRSRAVMMGSTLEARSSAVGDDAGHGVCENDAGGAVVDSDSSPQRILHAQLVWIEAERHGDLFDFLRCGNKCACLCKFNSAPTKALRVFGLWQQICF